MVTMPLAPAAWPIVRIIPGSCATRRTLGTSARLTIAAVSIRVGLSYNQANIYSYNFQDGTDGSTPTPGGLRGPFGDIYFYSHIQVDAQGSVRFAHGLDFIMYGLNLNNEVFRILSRKPAVYDPA